MALALGRLRRRERVLPAEIIPIVDVKAERDYVISARDFAEQRVGRRAGGAALRGEELDDDGRGLARRRGSRRAYQREQEESGEQPELHLPEMPERAAAGETISITSE